MGEDRISSNNRTENKVLIDQFGGSKNLFRFFSYLGNKIAVDGLLEAFNSLKDVGIIINGVDKINVKQAMDYCTLMGLVTISSEFYKEIRNVRTQENGNGN